MNKQLTCFKAYDVRGELGEELNDDIAYRVGRAFAQHLGARRVVIGGDIRLSSESLKQALAKGLMDAGADVIDLGMTGTEEIYFAAFHLDVDGGIEVTASHNPINYNGMKFVARDAKPISGDTGLKEIQRIAEAQSFDTVAKQGTLEQQSILNDYAEHLLGYINTDHLKPLKLVVNAGNGAAGHVIDALEQRFNDLNIPIQFVKIHHQPDGTFPNGIPNPLLPENREATTSAVIDNQADMGIAWDGDFDRCFLFDEKGAFIEGYYVVGLLAEVFLHEAPEEKIIHDPRLIWNTQDVVNKLGGIPIQSKTGHAFIKERMRMENAVYGGEMSAHHYFRDFAYCDSGMIPWLLVSQLLSEKKACLSELVVERMLDYPCSGEINYQVDNAQASIDNVVNYYLAEGCGREEVLVVDRTDGISLEFSQWRFNLRSSNTESLLRLNVESRADSALVDQCVLQIEALINLRK